MSFKEKLAKAYTNAYINKYGDRITQVQGHILSVKITTKTILWIYNIIKVDILVKPERSKAIVRCQYKQARWFKKPAFMQLSQGHLIVVAGVKGKKGKENSDLIKILNINNLTTKKELTPTGQKLKKVRQKQQFK